MATPSTLSTPTRSTPALVVGDWGTTAARLWLLDADGATLDEARGPGMQPVLQESTDDIRDPAVRTRAFAAAYRRMIAPWGGPAAQLPALLCGMVGASSGWVDAGYRELPSRHAPGAGELASAPGAGAEVLIIPGIVQRGQQPDVIRGEETQVLGALTAATGARTTVVAPGTHSKWITVEGDHITGFATHLTGELYDLLLQHSTLGRDAAPPHADPPDTAGPAAPGPAFDRAVRRALADGGVELSRRLFSARSAVLTGDLRPEEVRDHLSGLLIGAEIADRHATADRRIVVLGDGPLVRRYRRALDLAGVDAEVGPADATLRGLIAVATHRGLLDSDAPHHPDGEDQS